MNNARQQIFDRICNAFGRGELSTDEEAGFEQHLFNNPARIKPKWNEPDIERFVTKLNKASATITTIADLNQLPEAIARYLDAHQLKPELLLSNEEELISLPWENTRIHTGPNDGSWRVSLTSAYGGIAETGTLALLSSRELPTSLNFLSEHHIVLVKEIDIVGHLEEIWERMQKDRMNLPRAINLITGPSRTADIEQTIQLGAHGARQLHVVILAF